MLTKSGPVVEGVKDVPVQSAEITSLRYMEMSFYHWEVSICAMLWYNYWYQVFQRGAGAGRVRLGRLLLNTISDGAGNF